MHETHALLTLPTLLGIDLSITREVVLLWIAAAVTFVLLAAACRRREPIARGVYRNLFEALIEFVDSQVIREGIGPEGHGWASFLFTLFFFILFGNLLGMVPGQGHSGLTANLNVTAALALIVFIVTLFINIHRNGLTGFLRKFAPSGIPAWLYVLVVPIEVISWLARPVSLAIRLFANMMAGHYLLFLFIAMEMGVAWYLKSLPLVGAVAMGCFEIFACFIQAFIFTMLAGMYIREAIQEAH